MMVMSEQSCAVLPSHELPKAWKPRPRQTNRWESDTVAAVLGGPTNVTVIWNNNNPGGLLAYSLMDGKWRQSALVHSQRDEGLFSNAVETGGAVWGVWRRYPNLPFHLDRQGERRHVLPPSDQHDYEDSEVLFDRDGGALVVSPSVSTVTAARFQRLASRAAAVEATFPYEARFLSIDSTSSFVVAARNGDRRRYAFEASTSTWTHTDESVPTPQEKVVRNLRGGDDMQVRYRAGRWIAWTRSAEETRFYTSERSEPCAPNIQPSHTPTE